LKISNIFLKIDNRLKESVKEIKIMGNWKLEAFKMALYMSFPIGAFLLFNSPKFYENAIFEWRKELDKVLVNDPEIERFVKENQKYNMKKDIDSIQLTEN
jgi:protein PET100